MLLLLGKAWHVLNHHGQIWPVSFRATAEDAREAPPMALTDNGHEQIQSLSGCQTRTKPGSLTETRGLIALGPGSKLKHLGKRGVPSLGTLPPLCSV